MTMTASVLSLDRHAIKALRLTDLYSLHRVVYSLFEDVRSDEQKLESQSSGILFADQGGDFSSRNILMLSNREPAQQVQGLYGKVSIKKIDKSFLSHSVYRFKVIINPTRRDSASGKILGVKGRTEIGAWFIERASSSWGFSIMPENLQVDSVEVLRFKDKKEHEVTIAQAHVQGFLCVTDRDLFSKSFGQGIGRGKSFGCGLLQIVPIINQTN